MTVNLEISTPSEAEALQRDPDKQRLGNHQMCEM